MLQNKIVLAIASALVLFICVLFVVQPTSAAHAQANIHVQHENGGIVIFGSVAFVSGNPVSNLLMRVGAYDKHEHSETFFEMDHSKTNDKGQYKLWISSSDVKKHGDTLSLLIQPDEHHSYRQDLSLEPKDIASVTIAMSTPLIPIFPFSIFVY